MYVASALYVYAFRALTGDVIWRSDVLSPDPDHDPLGNIVQSDSLLPGGQLLFLSSSTYVRALFAANGTLSWSYKTSAGTFLGSPALTLFQGALFFTASVANGVNTSTFAISVSNGTLLWLFPAGMQQPLIDASGRIYFPDMTNFYALQLRMGPLNSAGGSTAVDAKPIWKFSLPMPTGQGAPNKQAFAAPAAALANDGTLWVGTTQSLLGFHTDGKSTDGCHPLGNQ